MTANSRRPAHSMASATKELPALPDDSAQDEATKPAVGVFRRLTSKLRSPSQSWVHVSTPPAGSGLEDVQEEAAARIDTKKDRPKRKVSTHMLAFPGTSSHRKAGLELENAFTSPEQRQAALRAAGLVAGGKPGRDTHGYKLPLSEQEKMLDREYSVTLGDAPRTSEERESEAQRIKEAWLKKNSENGSDSGASSRAGSRSPDRVVMRRRRKEEETEREQEREREKERERELTAPATPPKQLVLTTEQIRARRGNDPVFAPQGLMEAMQAYRPQNYRPPAGRKPSTSVPPAITQRLPVEPPSDTESDDSL